MRSSAGKRIALSTGPIIRIAKLVREHDPELAEEYSSIRRLLEAADNAARRSRRKGYQTASPEQEGIAHATIAAWANGQSVAALVRKNDRPWLKLDATRYLIHRTLNALLEEKPELFNKGDFEEVVLDTGKIIRLLIFSHKQSHYRQSLKAAIESGWRRSSYFPDGINYLDGEPPLTCATAPGAPPAPAR